MELMTVPAEIRGIIWRFLIGNVGIHIYSRDVHENCVPFSERKPTNIRGWTQGSRIQWKFVLCEQATNSKPQDEFSKDRLFPKLLEMESSFVQREHPAAHVCPNYTRVDRQFQQAAYTLLRLSRLVNLEVTHVLYSTNHFIFDHSNTWLRFIERRTPAQRMMLSSLSFTTLYSKTLDPHHWLHTRFERYFLGHRYWKKALSEPLLKQMKGLRRLHLNFRETLHEVPSRSWTHADTPTSVKLRDAIDQLPQILQSSTNVIKVTISYDQIGLR